MANTSVCHLESRRTRFGNPGRVSHSEGWYQTKAKSLWRTVDVVPERNKFVVGVEAGMDLPSDGGTDLRDQALIRTFADERICSDAN